ncbi:hypothetical protein H0O02_01575 [Candidatus Micrarchaeota archaeon]|nr:hypothetical protein [Candidatus Micrarchaeota archaeon]
MEQKARAEQLKKQDKDPERVFSRLFKPLLEAIGERGHPKKEKPDNREPANFCWTVENNE